MDKNNQVAPIATSQEEATRKDLAGRLSQEQRRQDVADLALAKEFEEVTSRLKDFSPPKLPQPNGPTKSELTQAMRLLISDLGARYSQNRVSLENFERYHPAQAKVLSEACQLAKHLTEFVLAGRGLILHGSVGTGKDQIMAALLYRAVSEHSLSVRWVNGLDLFGAVRDGMDDGRKEIDFFRTWSAPAILAISDPIPPLRDPSAWNIEILYRLIDRRYRNNKSTWMTLNAASVEEADEKLSAPVFDRLKEDAVILRCFWPSYRERQKKRA